MPPGESKVEYEREGYGQENERGEGVQEVQGFGDFHGVPVIFGGSWGEP